MNMEIEAKIWVMKQHHLLPKKFRPQTQKMLAGSSKQEETKKVM